MTLYETRKYYLSRIRDLREESVIALQNFLEENGFDDVDVVDTKENKVGRLMVACRYAYEDQEICFYPYLKNGELGKNATWHSRFLKEGEFETRFRKVEDK